MSEKLDSQQIDFLVAKKIMEWDLTAMGDGVFGWREWINSNSWTVMPQRNWKPSTNIAHTGQALEKFQLPEWEVEVETDRSHGKWYCSIDGPARHSAKAGTAPMAICLAALKAKGVDVTEFAP